MNFITENYVDILAWIGGIVSCASIIVKLTKTDKDDKVVYAIINFLEKFSVFNIQTKDSSDSEK